MHFASFAEAIFLLSKEKIFQDDIQRADRLLKYFCFMFDQLYDVRYMTINVHQLIHLTQCVRDLGSLWVFSHFHFEDKNGFLLKLFHGTQSIQLQVIYAISVLRHLFTKEDLFRNHGDNKLLAFFKKLMSKNNTLHLTEIDISTYQVGSIEVKTLTVIEFKEISDYLGYYVPINLKI